MKKGFQEYTENENKELNLFTGDDLDSFNRFNGIETLRVFGMSKITMEKLYLSESITMKKTRRTNVRLKDL